MAQREQGVMALHALGAAQLIDLCSFEAARVWEINIFQGRGQFGTGVLQACGQGSVSLPQPLFFHQLALPFTRKHWQGNLIPAAAARTPGT